MNKLIHIQTKTGSRFDVYDNRNGSVLGEIVRNDQGFYSYHPESTQRVIGEVVEDVDGAILSEVDRLNAAVLVE